MVLYLSYDKAKNEVLLALGYINTFSQNIDEKHPESGFTNGIIELETLMTRIEKSQGPFLKKDEIIPTFALIRKLVINWNKDIDNQLNKFWEVYSKALNSGKLDETKYLFTNYLKQRTVDILNVDSIFGSIVKNYNLNPNEDNHFYAFFFSHILYNEIIEYTFNKQLSDVIHTCGLHYDPAEILSIKEKVQHINRHTKKLEYVTDSKAIRDALAHKHFKIENNHKLIFKNFEYGYNFTKEMTIKEFLIFLQNSSLLYKSIFVILMILISFIIIKEYMTQE